MKKIALAVPAAFLAIFLRSAAGDPAGITVDLDHPGAKISPTFYGLMTEEINHSYDGGLYAELIQNRAMGDSVHEPRHWSVVKSDGADGSIALDTGVPLNDALKTSLRLDVANVGEGQRVGVANEGYWGIPVKPETHYQASFYAKGGNGFSGPLTVDIESNDGNTIYATGTVSQISGDWKKYELTLTTQKLDPTKDARFVISAGGKGSVWFDQVSLFPPTYNNRPNGFRIDLMDLMADLHPAFLRFPGGNYLEGDYIKERFIWENTIGDVAQRAGHRSPWNYHSTDGMGLLEFLEWCEDLHMQPLLAVYAGYSLQHIHVDAGPDLVPFVEEALDEIEYCTGDASTKWGAERAKDGHPQPFDIKYIEVGNEDFFDSAGYDKRFAQFYDAIKAKYPNLLLIATVPVKSRTPDVVDDHYYRSSRQMERDATHYDKTDRNGPKIFVGEWATTEGRPTPNFAAAMADAAWMTGLERNSDVVVMNCYAPLLVNVNHNASQWGTNLIGYDALNSFGSTSYYAQRMFAANLGDTIIPVEISQPAITDSTPPPPDTGGVGVGTWETQAQFKEIKVAQGDQTLLQSDFSSGTEGWRKGRNGTWSATGGVLTQSGDAQDTRITRGDPSWTDYTYSLKAMKTGGSEGFLILFHTRGRNDYLWWNVGGWGNGRTALEKIDDGQKKEFGTSADIAVETNRWYDISVEVSGTDIKCYLDGKLVTEATDPPPAPPEPIYATASRVDSTGQVILKVVNISSSPQSLQINLTGAKDVSAAGKEIVLTGKPTDENSLANPRKVYPQEQDVSDAGATFTHEFPAYSVNVLKIDAKP